MAKPQKQKSAAALEAELDTKQGKTTKNERVQSEKPEAKPAKEKKVKPVKVQLPVHSDEMTIEQVETFLTEQGHIGPDIERPDDIQAYLIECVEDKTFKQGKRTQKPKKAPKPAPVYEFSDKSAYEGRQVFTSRGTAHITRETTDGAHFEVRTPDGTLHVVNAATTRFKAVNEAYRDKYVKDDTIRTASGSPSIHTGDDVSTALLGTSLPELSGIAKENDLIERYNGWVESKKNPGMVRMNLGNVLRARVRKNEPVSIFGIGDIKLAAQKGAERGAKEAAAEKQRRTDAKKLRDDEAAKAKAEKTAKKEADAKAKAEALAAKPAKEKKVKVKPEVAKPNAKKAA